MGFLTSLCSRVKEVFSNITIEPIFFLFSLNLGFYIIVSKNLYVEKVCRVNLNFTDEVCNNIQQHEDEQVKVQEYVSSLQAYNRKVTMKKDKSLDDAKNYTHQCPPFRPLDGGLPFAIERIAFFNCLIT